MMSSCVTGAMEYFFLEMEGPAQSITVLTH